MTKMFERFHDLGIIPVVVLDHKEDAAPLANALCEGGLPAAEVTFRTREAAACIEAALKAALPTCSSRGYGFDETKHSRANQSTRRQFIVSPGSTRSRSLTVSKKTIPVNLGTCTIQATWQKAYRLGLDVVKFFPPQPAAVWDDQSDSAPYKYEEFHADRRHFRKETWMRI